MSTVFAERPQFFEGQYLGASDLQSLLAYLREALGRHQLGSHSWGISAGIDLVYQTSPTGEVEAYLTPGVATDGYGRLLVVNQAFPVDPGLLVGQPSGPVKLWLRYDEAAGQGVRPGFEVCGASDAYSRVNESFLVEAGERQTIDRRQSGVLLDGLAYADARDALGDVLPGRPVAPDGSVAAQRFPGEDEPSLWLVPVGIVLWQGGKLVEPDPESRKRSRLFRRHAGWLGETLSGCGGLLRLGTRFLPRQPGKSADAICDAALPVENDLIYCKADEDTPAFREPLWLDAHTRARGDLRFYGSRAEWLDPTGTDYLAQGTVTALRRNGRSEVKGVDLELLLGKRAGSAGPTRLVVGAATVKGDDACSVDFTLAAGLVIQEDGFVGIGSVDGVLDKPLTLRAVAGQNSLLGLENSSGALAFQINLGPTGQGFNLTRSDPAKSDLFVANNGNVGVHTLAPFTDLTVQGSLGFKSGEDPQIYLFENGTANVNRMVLAHSPAYPSWGLQYRDNGDSFVFLGSNQPRLYVGLQDAMVGVATDAPFAALTVQGSLGFKSGGAPEIFMLEGGSGTFPDRMVLARSPSQQDWGLQYRDGNDSFVFLASGQPRLSVGLGDGRIGVGTTAPASALDVRGDIRLGGAGNYFALGAGTALAVVAGRVSEFGVSIGGSGFGSGLAGIGEYNVSFAVAFASPPSVVVTPVSDGSGNIDNVVAVSAITQNGFHVSAINLFLLGSGSPQNVSFTFIAIGPRA